MEEIWKDIRGYEGYYQVSNTGKIKSLDRLVKWKNNKNRIARGKILSPRKQINYNYIHIAFVLQKDGIPKETNLARTVAKAFIPNPENKPCVNHIDNNPQNNHVSNLEWVTYKENTQHMIKSGRNNILRTFSLTEKQVKEIFEIKLKNPKFSNQKIGDMFNVSRETARGVLKHKIYTQFI